MASPHCSCQEEDVTLTDNALSVLTSMATQTTLRYALNLIATAQVLAKKRKAERVDVEDFRRAYAYFMDEKRSVQWLKEQAGTLMFEEVGPVAAEGMDES
jgi:RuvB-like protein 2